MKIKLRFGAWAFIALALPLSVLGQTAPTIEKSDVITHGPQLGNISSHSIRVWARTKQPTSFSVIYSTNADLSGATTSKPVQTTWVTDAT
ncbi:MAG TPA: hypothetical protein VGK59_15920, partial [Ohtaekwangia sp.]